MQFRNRNPDSWTLESEIQLEESVIPLKGWNSKSLAKDPESSTWKLEYTTWNPESKTVLNSLTKGR